jgi:hypothetical protein
MVYEVSHPLYSHQKYGGNSLMCQWERQQLPLVEFRHQFSVIFSTTTLFVAHK